MIEARFLRVRGVVQGVGFRPFVFRLAHAHGLAGWVLNGADGVEVHVEGAAAALDRFAAELVAQPPPAAVIAGIESAPAELEGFSGFAIRESARGAAPTVRISPDLPVCARCLEELLSPADRRRGYPYINCTDCGPRYSIVLSLPYDRPRTTMRGWPLCPLCAAEYADPLDRRFHAQPVACPTCGPHVVLILGSHAEETDRAQPLSCHPERSEGSGRGAPRTHLSPTQILRCAQDDNEKSSITAPADRRVEGDDDAISAAAQLLAAGQILAIKGIGGYHLGCDARNADAVAALRQRKLRREKPFALMARDLDAARELVELSPAAEALLTSIARPVVLAQALSELPGVAPDNLDLGIMLPYAPLHHLLFARGAPAVLVMTSANLSNEPIAYEDGDALARLAGVADAFLLGERPIARRVDDSVCRVTALGPAVLRRARGYAPGAVARLPAGRPILALGADLKNAVTLVVGGEAFVSQHLGDLEHYAASRAFAETVADLTAMYEVDRGELLVAHDLHPEYASTRFAETLAAGAGTLAVQHHRAHVASVLAERPAADRALERRVVGVAFDGTGYGDDGAIWGGEFFAGSVLAGFDRAAHLRSAQLAGGDAAARHPVQAAAGFLAEIDGLPDLTAAPFRFPRRYAKARELIDKGLRAFPTTSAGRLFDTAAALLGFTREIGFEGQAAIWLEHQARTAPAAAVYPLPYPMPFDGRELDFRPLLSALIEERAAGRPVAEIARAFHSELAAGVAAAAGDIARREEIDTVVLSGGVFQNRLLLEDVAQRLATAELTVWTNRQVPANDGGISLGQAALALGIRR